MTVKKPVPILALCLAVFVAGCPGTIRMTASRPELTLLPADSLLLATPAAGLCRDGDRVVVLDAGGDRLVLLSARLVPGETIPLGRRLVGPRGVRADRFYYYIWDSRVVWRMSKEKLELGSWLGNVEVAGMTSFAPGEMLVSDASRKVVWHKTVFGESRRFLSESELSNPGALATMPDGRFCVISGNGHMVHFNRAGVLTGTDRIPDGCDIAESDDRGTVYLMETGIPEVWTLARGRTTGFRLPGCSSPVGFAVLSSTLVVLDAGTRVLSYVLPQL